MSTSLYCLYILKIFLFFIVSILKKLEQLQRKLLPLKFPKRRFDELIYS